VITLGINAAFHDSAAALVVDGELVAAGQPVSRLAARIGQTPFYAYDRRLLRERVDELRAALPRTGSDGIAGGVQR